LEYFTRYLFTVLPINLLEITAIVAGIYFINKKPDTLVINKYLVKFLWFTLLVEITAKYASIAYFSEYEIFGFIKDTVFVKPYWLYNTFDLVFFSFYAYYFNSFLINNRLKKLFKAVIFMFLFICVLNLLLSGMFFKGTSILISIFGTLLLLVVIISFYFDLLKSDKIVNLKKYLPIYISFGVLVYSLCTTPLGLFSQYFKAINQNYVVLRTNILLGINIIMYGTFIIGFIVCAKSNPNKKELLN